MFTETELLSKRYLKIEAYVVTDKEQGEYMSSNSTFSKLVYVSECGYIILSCADISYLMTELEV